MARSPAKCQRARAAHGRVAVCALFVAAVAGCHGFPGAAQRTARHNYPAVKAFALQVFQRCRDKKLQPQQSPVVGTAFAKSAGLLEVQVVCPGLVVGFPSVTLPPIHGDKWKRIRRGSEDLDLGKPEEKSFARRYARAPSLLVKQKNSVDVCIDGKAVPGKEPPSICVAYDTK